MHRSESSDSCKDEAAHCVRCPILWSVLETVANKVYDIPFTSSDEPLATLGFIPASDVALPLLAVANALYNTVSRDVELVTSLTDPNIGDDWKLDVLFMLAKECALQYEATKVPFIQDRTADYLGLVDYFSLKRFKAEAQNKDRVSKRGHTKSTTH